MALLEVDRLTVEFPTRRGILRALDAVSFDIEVGEVLGVVGESGAGKSLTGAAIIGLLEPPGRIAGGQVRLDGMRIDNLSRDRMRPIRGRQIGAIFQDPLTTLNPLYAVGHQLVETMQAHLRLSDRDARERAVRWLEEVGIPAARQRIDAYPHEFSGGMRQRAVIAIGMANDPEVILADEPTTALDVTVQAQVLDSLRTALSETGAALLLITHDLGVIAGISDRVLVMYAGRAVETGTAEDVFYKPSMPYTLGLLGSLPRLDSDGNERLRQIPGSPPSMMGDRTGCPFAPRCPLATEICITTEPDLVVVPSVTSAVGGHRAACHFAVEVGRGDHGKVFSDGVVDDVVA